MLFCRRNPVASNWKSQNCLRHIGRDMRLNVHTVLFYAVHVPVKKRPGSELFVLADIGVLADESLGSTYFMIYGPTCVSSSTAQLEISSTTA